MTILVQAIAREFIEYYTRDGGCSNCGGLPHSSTCFVGRFLSALGSSASPSSLTASEGGTVPAFASDYQRMWDLVRSQRSELLDAGLITREEYALLLSEETKGKPGQGSPSARRLENYDELRAQPEGDDPIHTGDDQRTDAVSGLAAALDDIEESAKSLPQQGGEEASIIEAVDAAREALAIVDRALVAQVKAEALPTAGSPVSSSELEGLVKSLQDAHKSGAAGKFHDVIRALLAWGKAVQSSPADPGEDQESK